MQSEALGVAPKMLWTYCPENEVCDKCLDVSFEEENDIACLKQKYTDNECIFEGNFLAGEKKRIFLSSEQCQQSGGMDLIQVIV